MNASAAQPVIRLGISTCPNDTFAFHGLLNGKTESHGLRFEISLLDIQELNERLAAGRLDVGKASFFAAMRLADSTVVLPCGAALGFGVGPVLLARRPTDLRGLQKTLSGKPATVLCPGETTTAAFLTQTLLPFPVRMVQVPFSQIMPRLVSGDADLGTCIHEGRFVFRELGLHLVADLGELWEQQTEVPLPLGGLLARRDLSEDVLERVQSAIAESLRYAHAHRSETLPTMRRYAQEMSDNVLFAHVDLYVNDWTSDLGLTGEQSLATMHQLAIDRGVLSPGSPRLRIWQHRRTAPAS
jgi:1,4-dihydroxy-6-naphthoate synthase